jgi:hypothetical protein
MPEHVADVAESLIALEDELINDGLVWLLSKSAVGMFKRGDIFIQQPGSTEMEPLSYQPSGKDEKNENEETHMKSCKVCFNDHVDTIREDMDDEHCWLITRSSTMLLPIDQVFRTCGGCARPHPLSDFVNNSPDDDDDDEQEQDEEEEEATAAPPEEEDEEVKEMID